VICPCWTTPYMLWLYYHQLVCVCNVSYLLKRLPASCLLSCQHLSFFPPAPALRGRDLSVWLRYDS
jgi:hypothetical protein